MTLSDKVLGAESHWLMGRVMPREFLEGIGKYLHHFAPDREDEVMAAIRARAEELADADRDMIVDEASKGALAVSAVALAAYENLLPVFDDDERRTILYLQHVMGGVLERPYDLTFSALSQKDDGLDKIQKACENTKGLYGKGWHFDFDRPEPGLFEMKVGRCLFRDYFARHGVPLVTTVMCAFDVTFMQAIDPAVSGLRAERTSLLSLGDDECRFAVLETDDPLAHYTDALETRFVEKAR